MRFAELLRAISRYTSLFFAVIFALILSACGSGEGDDAAPPVADDTPQTTISGVAPDFPDDGARVSVEALDGTSLGTTETTAGGAFSVAVEASKVADGFVVLAAPDPAQAGVMDAPLKAVFGPSDNYAEANVTVLTTLIAETADQLPDGDVVSRRDSAVGLLEATGAIESGEWRLAEPANLNLAGLRKVISRDGLTSTMTELASDIVDGTVSADNIPLLPRAHGGLVDLQIAQGLILSEFPGESGNIDLRVNALDPTQDYSIELLDGPSWISLDASPRITYTIPQSATRDDDLSFSLRVSDPTTGFGREVSAEFFVVEGGVIALGSLRSVGDRVTDDTGVIGVELVSGDSTGESLVTVQRGRDASGNVVLDVDIEGQAALDYRLILPDPEILDVSTPTNQGPSTQSGTNYNFTKARASVEENKAVPAEFGETGCIDVSEDSQAPNCWLANLAYFYEARAGAATPYNRVPVSVVDTFRLEPEPGDSVWKWDGNFNVNVSSQLQSSLSREQLTGDAPIMGEPVLFIHGYASERDGGSNILSGGKDYWGNFPGLVAAEDAIGGGVAIPFLFRWSTNARFSDVADDLRNAIALINEKTGKPVHIVAHSFGGLLTRALVQNLTASGVNLAEGALSSISTIGTPHAGIFDSDANERGGATFPKGQDGTLVFNACAQTSCFQAGENVGFSDTSKAWLGLSGQTFGDFIGEIADLKTNELPEVPINVLIGLTADCKDLDVQGGLVGFYVACEEDGREVEVGDALITYHGQRFSPAAVDKELWSREAMAPSQSLSAQHVGEYTLGADANLWPGKFVTEIDAYAPEGYKHSNNSAKIRGSKTQVSLGCSDVSCKHAAWTRVREHIGSQGRASYEPETVDATVVVRQGDNTGIADVTVRFRVEGTAIHSAEQYRTDSGGQLTATLPFYPGKRYTAVFTKDGYSAAQSNEQTADLMAPATPLVFESVTLQPIDETNVDADGIDNASDNCPYISNDGQSDRDSDGIGDACDRQPDTDNVPPTTPSGLSALAVSPTGINVSWNPSVDGAGIDSYELARGGEVIIATSNTWYADRELEPSTEYCYAVTAIDSSGLRAVETPPVCAGTFSESVPDGVTAVSGNGEVTVSWSQVPEASGYSIYWSNAPGVTTGDSALADVESPYTQTGLTNDRDYYYIVTAFFDGVETESSREVKATPRNATSQTFNQVLFATTRDGNSEIYAADFPPGDSQRNLTNDPADDRLVVMAPRLDKFAFVSDRDGNNEVYGMTVDGSSLIRMTNETADDAPVAWSPDGSQLLFVSDRTGNYDIFSVDSAASIVSPLTNSSADDTAASWSPDGSRVVFASERDGNLEIYAMNADGTDKVNLTNDSADDDIPFFSPDGGRIAFVSDRAGDYDLYTMDVDGTNVFKITGDDGDEVGWYAWSPDGSRIAYDSAVDGDYEVYVVDRSGTNQKKLTDNEFQDQYASWTIDGSGILFVSDRDGNAEIYLVSAEGGEQINLTNDPADDWIPVFSPVYGPINCFIATAAYGSFLHEDVALLRQFRDEHLMTNAPGRVFVDMYYRVSPPIAAFIAEHEALRLITRMVLTPVFYMVKYPLGGLILLLVALMAPFAVRRHRVAADAATGGLD